jgi:5,10-methylenetetrahydromethanopterin reductase
MTRVDLRPTFGIALAQRFTLEENLRLAELADQVGFDRVACADNLFMRPVWPVLTAVARVTRRVEIGPLVTHPVAVHPAVTAAHLAQLDEISRGRAFLGIGRGTLAEQAGITPRRPIAAVREAIEVIARLLRGDRQGFQGTVFSLAGGAALRWTPRRPRVPVVVGTAGPRLAEVAGELADGVNVGFHLDPAHLPLVARHMARGATKAGRDPASLVLGCGPMTAVDRDGEAARERARQELGAVLPALAGRPGFPPVDPGEVAAVEAALRQGGPDAAARHVSPATLDAFCLAGTPADLVARVEALLATGVRHVTFCPPLGPDPEDAVRQLGETVLPRFRRR